ncbi:type II secretion system F family protein [Otariodibacter sp.]|uniref:type II secretion system F family protein n=1 Tax=Otariodibacter sp. TaxID=3030919 RepID=UPI0026390B7A|nr:type II secretion system F family protein [Otariodibacter sp.]
MHKLYEYRWKGLNQLNVKQKGKSLAQSDDDLEQKLTTKGYSHIHINRNFVIPQKPKYDEITQVINQLSLLLNAGIPLKSSLNIITNTCLNIKLTQWLLSITAQLEKGFNLSHSLQTKESYLSTQEILLVKIGEKSGRLSTILEQIVLSRLKSEGLRKKVNKIVFYPVIILSISIILSLLLMIFIVPQFAELYTSKDKELPLLTEIVFNLSSFIIENYACLIFTFLAVFIIYKFLLKKKTEKLKHKLFTYIPIFGQIIHTQKIVFFFNYFSLMLDANLKLENILHTFLNASHNDPFLNREISIMLSSIQKGYYLHQGINGHIFGEDVVQMIYIGEKSGKLSSMMNKISQIYQERLEYKIDILSQLLEPIIMLVIGSIVSIIIIALYLPIFELGSII